MKFKVLPLKLFFIFFTVSLLFYVSQLSAKNDQMFSHCPCEQIKREKKCDNPDCIKICNLQDFLNQTTEEIHKQCLKEETHAKTWTHKRTPITQLESIIKQSKEKIKDLEKKSKKHLQENCHDCHLTSNVSVRFQPQQSKKSCPEEYLKTHSYNHSTKLNSGNNKRPCRQEQKTEMLNYFSKYIKNIVSDSGNNELSKKLWRECPGPCSFDIDYVIQIDEDQCSGKLNLNVTCTHKVKRSMFVPIYDVVIAYRGGLQCEER